jgi:prepilin-type N-terminal cleavage/methylation domain-containing protein
MLKKLIKSSNEAFTLIELLVGVSAFTILMAAAVQFFASSLVMQQFALLSQWLLDNVSYNFEYMSRALRMAQKDESGVCIASGKNYDLTHGDKGIKFLNYNNECWEFYWDEVTANSEGAHSLKVVINGKIYSLTSEFLDVVGFKVIPTGWDSADPLQPKTTLIFEGRMIKNKKKPELQPNIVLQTTISMRNLDE